MAPRWLHPIKYLKETIGLYDNLIYTHMIKNSTSDSLKRNAPIDKVSIDQVGMYSEDNVSFFYLIDDLPNFVFVDFKSRLRRECQGDVCITYIDRLFPHKIAWNSPEMQSKLRILRNLANEMAEKEVNAFNMNSSLKDIRRQEWIQESLQYLSEADVDRNRALYRMSMVMIVSGERGEDFDKSIDAIEQYAEQLGIKLHRVLYDIPAVMSYFSPWSQSQRYMNRGGFPTFVLPDEILARFNTYSQGTLGYRGVCFGTDIYSHFPVLKQVKKSVTTAENWLITAETGGGKSYFVKAIILQLLALGYNGTIMDIEGFEYLPLARMLKRQSSVKVINMAEGQGGYFDPVEIPIYANLDYDDQVAMRNNSREFTLSTFRVLLGKAYDENVYMSAVIDDAVSLTYIDAGVTDDMNTWGLSQGLTLFDVFNKMKTLKDYRPGIEPYAVAVDEALTLLSKYFDPKGTRASLFHHRVAISDIIGADLVVCSFGMAGKSQDSIDQAQLALMQLGAAQLSHQRSIFSKTRGKFNFKLWEEFQRWGKFPGSEKTLGTALTGGRKLGDVNIIITNVVAELLGEDKFNIFSNITSFLCGAIGDSAVRTELCTRLSIPNMLPELNAISTVRANDDDGKGSRRNHSIYEFSFLCGLDKSKYAIVKMNLPPNLEESDLFKTGVNTDIDTLQERI